MTVTLGEVPQVARLEVVDLARARRLEHHRLASPVDDEGPFGGDGVPMQLARRARVEEHMDARDPLAHRELMDRRLLRPTAGGDLWIVAVERIDVVRHLLDVFGVMVRDLGAGWQLHRVAAIPAVSWLADVVFLRGQCLRQRKPTCTERRCAQKSTSCRVHDSSSCICTPTSLATVLVRSPLTFCRHGNRPMPTGPA